MSRNRPPGPTILALALAVCAATVLGAEEDAYHTLRIGAERPALAFGLLAGGRGPTWEELAGRVAVIDFWATWCAPCVESFPKFNRLEAEFAGEPIAFYSVTYEPASMIRPFLAEHPLHTQIGLDRDFATFQSFRAWGIPAVYIFDREGVLASAVHPEHLTAEVLREVLAGEIPKVEQTRGWDDPEGAERYFRSLVVGDGAR